MRKSIIFVLLAAVAALVLVGCSTPAPSSGGASGGTSGGTSGAAKAASVDIASFAFSPSSIEVAVGGTVTWTNSDSPTHTVKGEGWASGDLATGATFSHTFDTAGTFPYSCSIHPSMTGEVVVK